MVEFDLSLVKQIVSDLNNVRDEVATQHAIIINLSAENKKLRQAVEGKHFASPDAREILARKDAEIDDLKGKLRLHLTKYFYKLDSIATQRKRDQELAVIKSAKTAELETKSAELREIQKELGAALETLKMTKKVLATTSKSYEDAEARRKKLAKQLAAKEEEIVEKEQQIISLKDDLDASKAASKHLAIELQQAAQAAEVSSNAQATLAFKHEEELKGMRAKAEELLAARNIDVTTVQSDLAELRKKYERMEIEKNAEIQRAVNAKTEQVAKYKERLERTEEENRRLMDQTSASDELIQQARRESSAKINEKDDVIDKLRTEIAHERQKLTSVAKSSNELEKRIAEMEKSAEESKATIERLGASIKAYEEAASNEGSLAKQEVGKLMQERAELLVVKAQAEEAAERARKEADDLEAKNSELKNVNGNLKTMVAAAEKGTKKADQALQRKEAELDELKKELTSSVPKVTMQEELAKLQKELLTVKEEASEKTTSLVTLQGEIEKLRLQNEEVQEHATRARKASMEIQKNVIVERDNARKQVNYLQRHIDEKQKEIHEQGEEIVRLKETVEDVRKAATGHESLLEQISTLKASVANLQSKLKDSHNAKAMAEAKAKEAQQMVAEASEAAENQVVSLGVQDHHRKRLCTLFRLIDRDGSSWLSEEEVLSFAKESVPTVTELKQMQKYHLEPKDELLRIVKKREAKNLAWLENAFLKDEDAKVTLNEFLNKMEQCFEEMDGEEITVQINKRISSIKTSRLQGRIEGLKSNLASARQKQDAIKAEMERYKGEAEEKIAAYKATNEELRQKSIEGIEDAKEKLKESYKRKMKSAVRRAIEETLKKVKIARSLSSSPMNIPKAANGGGSAISSAVSEAVVMASEKLKGLRKEGGDGKGEAEFSTPELPILPGDGDVEGDGIEGREEGPPLPPPPPLAVVSGEGDDNNEDDNEDADSDADADDFQDADTAASSTKEENFFKTMKEKKEARLKEAEDAEKRRLAGMDEAERSQYLEEKAAEAKHAKQKDRMLKGQMGAFGGKNPLKKKKKKKKKDAR